MVLPLVIGMLLGGVVGLIAEQKNRSFFPWAIYGFFLFFFAIIHIAVIGDKAYEDRQLAGMGYKKCPACAEMVKNEAVICKHCRTVLESNASVKEPVRPLGDSQNACRWCKIQPIDLDMNKCPSCGGLQKHLLKDNPVLLVLIFCLAAAFLIAVTQLEQESFQPRPSSEETATFQHAATDKR